MMQKLNQFLGRLQKLAEEFNLAVLLTNQVQADPGVSCPRQVLGRQANKPAGRSDVSKTAYIV